MDTLLSLPLNYLLFINMEKNRPISVAFDDIRYKLDIINHHEYRFINDDLGMVISFIQMGSKLFHIGQPYRAKEGRIIRVLQGTGRISINLIEYEVSTHQIIIIPDNSLIELFEISPDYDFQIIVPACNFLPVLPGSILSETYTRNGIVLSLNEEEWTQAEMFLPCCGIYFIPRPIVVKPYSISSFPCFTTLNILTSKRAQPLPCAFRARKKFSAAS